MKKLQSIVLVLVVAFLASCSGGSLESMVKDYEKACEKGNVVKAEKIANQIAEKYPDNAAEWTDELMERVMTASVTLMKNVEEDAMDVLGDALEEVDIEDEENEEDEW